MLDLVEGTYFATVEAEGRLWVQLLDATLSRKTTEVRSSAIDHSPVRRKQCAYWVPLGCGAIQAGCGADR
jgi:hypothetical protein